MNPAFSKYINTSCDDLKSSLFHVTDLNHAREILAAMPQSMPTKRKLVEARIRALEKSMKAKNEPEKGLESVIMRHMTGSEGLVFPPEAEVPAIAEEPIAAQFAQARTFHTMIGLSLAQSAAFMVLCGGELERLHKLYGVHAGQPKKNSALACGILWAELVAREVGCAESTSRKYREMFAAAKKRLPELNAEELLNTPLSQLPELRRVELMKAVQKLTDGETAQQLMWDWGIAKKPRGAGLKGGARHVKCPHCKGNLKSGNEQVCPHCKKETGFPEANSQQEDALDIWKPLMERLWSEGLEEKSWAFLPDAMLRELKGLVIDLNKLLPKK